MSSLQQHVSECKLVDADEHVKHCAAIIKRVYNAMTKKGKVFW